MPWLNSPMNNKLNDTYAAKAAELEKLGLRIAALKLQIEALLEAGATSGTTEAPNVAKTQRKPRARAPKGLLERTILDHVRSNQDVQTGEVHAALKPNYPYPLTYGRVFKVVAKLLTDRKLTGEKVNGRWILRVREEKVRQE